MIKIDKRIIGNNCPPYIVAELSANHNGDFDRAIEIINIAKEQGADAIKLQTYQADTMTIDSDTDDFQITTGLWKGYNLYKLYQWAQTPYEWHEELFRHSKKIGLTCFSTPFDESAIDLLEDLNSPAYKIASFEATDIPLVKYAASTKKPLIISTGMANYEEISEVVQTARDAGCSELVLLHCVSSYPAPLEAYNLKTIPDLSSEFNVDVGLSDHTMGIDTSLAGIALGACLIEKHVTTSREHTGPDSEFSLEPDELGSLCKQSLSVWKSLGKINYELRDEEKENLRFRRSIYVVEDIEVGEQISIKNIRRIRPSFGLEPKYFDEVLGKTAKVVIKKGTPLSWEMME
ncbi:MAG: pseudaminic acid synthase [Gammaproteobacteria bacterium]|jgi:N-acetylneuraminate synthase|nr:pseudaminic acid synthase [Gammaproteobacteria bacterium]MBT5216216.1 pseudaminic acid synthase [Gammaproteobacteria bacterium]MBT5542546.1 pseudaminic acid synthase [Gammaproteobacteria bacterium]